MMLREPGARIQRRVIGRRFATELSRDDAVNDVLVLEIHDEPGIFPARDRRLADGRNLGDRSAELARNLIHGHAAGRRGDIGFLDGNAVVDGDGLGPREAARRALRQAAEFDTSWRTSFVTAYPMYTLRPLKLYHRLGGPILDSINTLIMLPLSNSRPAAVV